jgi:hypothetical protein
MSNYYLNYNKTDEKIDKYLGTNNLRPGPPRKLVNKRVLGIDSQDLGMKSEKEVYKDKIEYDQIKKINYNSSSMELNTINWSE